MKKRLYILSLVFTFFVSTTGLPVTMHLCKMMEEASAEQCNMCADTQIPETMACCEDDNFAGEVITSSNFSGCCEIQLVDNKVEDEFLYLKVEVKNDLTSSIVELPLSVIFNASKTVKSHSPFAFDSSPPSLENDLYIYNSVLII